MDHESEVQRCGPFGQFLHVAGGRVDVNLVLEEIHLQGVHKLAGVALFTLALKNFAQPGKLLQIFAVDAAFFFIQPVGGHAVFGLTVHIFSPNLDFNTFSVGANDRGVQALVAIGFGHGDIVFEASVHGPPLRMHQPQHGVTVPDVLDQHAKSHNVVHFVQGQRLGLHFFVNAVLVLDAAVDLPNDIVGGQ